jgi:hypothetical protein
MAALFLLREPRSCLGRRLRHFAGCQVDVAAFAPVVISVLWTTATVHLARRVLSGHSARLAGSP